MTATTWRGRIIGDNRIWGPDGLLDEGPLDGGQDDPGGARDGVAEGDSPLFLVGVDGVPPQTVPGALLPDQLMRGAGGLCLPRLGDVPAAVRLMLIGFQSLNPDWDGIAIVTGPSASHWITLSAGEAIHHQGSAVPEIARALGCDAITPTDFGVGMDGPERLGTLIYETREDAARLGALIGADVGGNRGLWLGQQAAVMAMQAGSGWVATGYVNALSSVYVPVTRSDTPALIRAGFRALARKFLTD